MIICSCNRLDHKAIQDAARRIAAAPDRKLVTPGGVFKQIGCRPRCGGCFALVVEMIYEVEPGSARLTADWKPERPALAPPRGDGR